MGYWNAFPPYVPVRAKRARAAAKLKKLQKSNPRIQPVVLAGSAIAATWWGKSWNQNLERYADYANRIGRGRSYVRNGAVLDLQIRAGEATALVQGTSSQPYEINIQIEKLAPRRWDAAKKACAGRLASLPELLAGKFPRDLGEIFMEEGKGLFPAPKEISFSCSCPDWAYMCKHVAAALYGIGARLDNDPGLFFTLRGIEVGELVSAAVTETTRDLLRKAGRQSRRVLTGVDLSDVFGIDLAEEGAGPFTPAGGGTKRPAMAKEKPAGRAKRTPAATLPPLELVERLILASRKGIDTATLVKKTGLTTSRIRGLVQRLRMQGRIVNLSWGVYGKGAGPR